MIKIRYTLHNRVNFVDDTAELVLYGDVVDKWPIDYWTGKPVEGSFICVDDLLEDLEQLRDQQNVTIRISSLGGDLHVGLTVYARLKDLKAHKTVIVDGIAASAATAIAMAGDVIRVHASDQIMIHDPVAFLYGYYNLAGLKDTSKALTTGVKSLVEAYAAKTGLDPDKIKSMLMATTWMTGREAVEAGFADELIGGDVDLTVADDLSAVVVNGVRQPVRGVQLPDCLKERRVAATAVPIVSNVITATSQKGGDEIMTLDELRQGQPDLVRQIEDAARAEGVQAERRRLQDIEDIASTISDATLLHNAKFGDKPMDAATLALEALKAQASTGAGYIAKMQSDYKASGSAEVWAAPKPETPENKTAEEIRAQEKQEAINLITGVKKEVK